MYVDISMLFDDISIVENITFKLSESFTVDELGNESSLGAETVSCDCIIIDKSVNKMDTRSGIYVKNSIYDIYIPMEFAINNSINEGDIVIRNSNHKEYQVVSEPTVKQYASHCVMRVTEERFA